MEFKEIELRETTIEIIDGDRGKNYPKKTEMKDIGHTLFLNNKNIINDYLDISKGEYISEEKSNLLRKGKLERNDLVMSTRGSVGNIGYFSEKIEWDHIRINSGMVILRNRDSEIDTEYLYFLLKSPLMKERYKELISGSVQNQLPIRDLQRVKLIYPEVHKQKQIVQLIGSLENKMQLNKKVINNLEEISQTLFKHWFIDFEFPNEQGHPYKSSGGEMVESELGKIPKTFKRGTIKDFCELKYGKALTKENRIAGLYPVYGSGGVTGTHKEYLIEGPGLIIGRKGSIGKLYLEFNNFYPIDTVFYTESAYYSPNFLYQVFKQYDFTKANNDSAVPGLNRDFVYNTKAVIPDNEVVKEFEKIISPMYEQINNLLEENQRLEQICDTLLPKLLSGEMELPDNLEVK
ncbi:restriction endonuclease subunit S [Bacillus pseudomycoides]|uniref:restriction endonuclease subunit S n=1 Tax=Bacillus pseudomycoides TaxID=64104 RepID=UPI000508156F|nr:restriction endonuclease subunit S [Bacillus pseudomycoides]PEU03536.1 restriction endonuclease subunit S [Bacillus cereus]KFN13720.1 type I restriction modification DNA specificity domain protein [Bacillus pseudomycoides]MDR4187789.1 restriction endonuclease subunit S [Bacillus pseudomycoides]MED0857244.1 restriction endonuclease subunit S [Bacillus pseudomycoides]PGO02626.1 restriction endonuclease subunit S [Bacillus cereus]